MTILSKYAEYDVEKLFVNNVKQQNKRTTSRGWKPHLCNPKKMEKTIIIVNEVSPGQYQAYFDVLGGQKCFGSSYWEALGKLVDLYAGLLRLKIKG